MQHTLNVFYPKKKLIHLFEEGAFGVELPELRPDGGKSVYIT